MSIRPQRPRRTVLYVPATNERALAKLSELQCDCVILDLEDSVSPESKQEARERASALLRDRPDDGREWVLRVNALASPWGREDLSIAAACSPDGILLPKVDGQRDILEVDEVLDGLELERDIKLWAMIETPWAMLNLGAIAELGRDQAARLACLVAGSNDLAKDTGLKPGPGRRNLVPWLLDMVLAARAGGLDVIDAVSNDFRDLDAFAAECAQGAELGFDGKSLIHPAQIAPALAAFSPSREEIHEAQAIRALFARPENARKGALSMDGRMVERLHLDQAERVLAKAGITNGDNT
jgi:citrate lyase subunit beta / citryl-CoA lyase